MQVILNDARIDLFPAGAVVLVMLAGALWRRQRGVSVSYLLCYAIFGVYLLFALDVAFFPIAISGSEADMLRAARSFAAFVNVIPFNFNLSEMPDLVYRQIFQNMLLTIPFGFGVSFVTRVRARDFRWLIPAVGLGAEAVQLVISLLLRYPYRVIDVNDAMLNALGVLIGYGSFRSFAWLYIRATQRLNIRHRWISAYVYDVALRAQAR